MENYLAHGTTGGEARIWFGVNGACVAEVRLEAVTRGRALTATVSGEQVFQELFRRPHAERLSEARMREFIGILLALGWRTAPAASWH
jgi:hypothetical protein